MLKTIIGNLIVLGLYGGWVFQFMNPDHPNISWVSNFSALYAILATIVMLLCMGMVLATTLMKAMVKNKVLSVKERDIAQNNKSKDSKSAMEDHS